MDIKTILATVDHTLLAQTATWEDIKTICDDGMKHNVASVCLPPSFVKQASDYVKGKIKVCTVIGFPNGYNTCDVKVFETKNALENGADEIDMVANLGLIKSGLFDEITAEIRSIKQACGSNILKVIIEACLLTDDEKIKMCKCVTDAGADYIKTSTGFSTSGATIHDIKLFKQNIGKSVKIKAAGGIKTLDDAREFINEGALRLGTSSIVKIINGGEVSGY